MAKVNEITIGIRAKVDGLQKDLETAKADIKKLEAQTQKSGAAIENAFAGVSKSANLAAGFIGGMVGGGTLAGVQILGRAFEDLMGMARDAASAIFQASVETERWEMRMEMLVGAGDEAKRMLGDIIKLSEDVPIAVGALVSGADRMLVLTGEKAFASVKSMKELADLAVFTGNKFDDTTEKVGRFFQDLQAGNAGGVGALKAAGLVTAGFVTQLEELVKRQGTVSEAWDLFVQDTERARGAMQKSGETWDGTLTQMINLASELASEIGAPFRDAAKDGIKIVIDWIKGPEGTAMVEQLKDMSREAGEFLKRIAPDAVDSAATGLKSLIEYFNGQDWKNAVSAVGQLSEHVLALINNTAKLFRDENFGNLAEFSPKGYQASIDKRGGAAALNKGTMPFNLGSIAGVLLEHEKDSRAGFEIIGDIGREYRQKLNMFSGRDPGSGLTEPDPGNKRFKGKGGRKARSKKAADGPGWLEANLESWVDAIFDEAYRHAQDWGRLTEDLTRKTMLLAGASKEQMLAFELTKGSLKDSTNKDLEEQSARMEWALEAKAQGKARVEQLRDQARETGALALVQETLSKAEMHAGTLGGALFTARAKQTLAVHEGNIAAKAMIESYREELGLLPKLTEAGKALAALMKPENKDVSVKDRFKILGLASDLDGKHARDAMKGFIEDLEQQLGIEKKISQEYILREKLRSGQFHGGWSAIARAFTLAKMADGTMKQSDASTDGIQNIVGMSDDMRQLMTTVEDGADRMAYVVLDAFGRIGEGAGAMFETLTSGLRSTLADMAAEFLQSQIRGLLMNLLGGAFRGGGGGKFNADGAGSGSQSMVSAAGGRAPVVVNMPVYVQDPGGLKKSMGQIQQEAFAKASEAARRNG